MLTPKETRQKNPSAKIIGLFGEMLADIFPDQTLLGGAPFNVARHLKALGAYPVLITRTGSDKLREDFLAEMEGRGMETSAVQCDPVYPTGQVKVTFKNDNPEYEILSRQAYDHIDAGLAYKVSTSFKPELIYFGTLAQRGTESRLALDVFLSEEGCPRFLDINLRKPWYNRRILRRSLLRADIVKMNKEELDIVSSHFRIEGENSQQKALALLQQFKLKQILITCGEAGSWLLNEKEELVKAEPVSMEDPIIDTVGAGDAFAAVYIMGLLLAWDDRTTLQRANQLASAICRIKGAVPSSPDFYAPFKQQWQL